MAKIPRVTQPIFAGSAANNGQFGSAQAATFVLSNDLATLMSLPAYAQGWLLSVLGGDKFPPLEELQALSYIETTQLAYIFQEGIVEYDAGTTYWLESIVKKPGTFQLFGSLTNANVGNALPVAPASNANWKYLCDLSALGASVHLNIQTFSTTSIYNPTAGLLFALVREVGGGGGGGSDGTAQYSAGGGGSGEYAEGTFSAATIGASQTVTIGAAGTSNNPGGTTSFGALLTAVGGSPGASTPAVTTTSTSTCQGGQGGTGGTGTGLHIKGETGDYGTHHSIGSDSFDVGGKGANSPFGAGAPWTLGANANGNNATGAGSGGSGGCTGGSGGTAGAGYVEVYEFYSA
jgi:hypothetical protein